MFPADTYIKRRKRLIDDVKSGVILFLGNDESPMNYPANPYHFRQDSSFSYFFGLDLPGLAAVIDVDQARITVFGDDVTVEDIVWTGPLPTLRENCRKIGVENTAPSAQLENILKSAVRNNRKIHFLPPYRPENILKLQRLLGVQPDQAKSRASVPLIKAVVAQRSIKSAREVEQIETALEVSYLTHTYAFKNAKPGMYEWEIVGGMDDIVHSRGMTASFPIIFTIKGQTLHNHYHGNIMQAGNIAINDSGIESPLHYASDITRTIPIGGKFTDRQKEIYRIVLDCNTKAIDACKPGIEFRAVHALVARTVLAGLKDVGLVQGDLEEAFHAHAHTLFFPHGLGHMLGLDVHDMEDLGEDYVGYTDAIKRRPEFGWAYLRLAKALEPGHIVTIEPGIYFIPELIDRWHADKKCESFINYQKLLAYKDFGGIRIEDDVLVTEDGRRLLGQPIPKTIEDVQNLSS
ncbi:MAG: Xaa-Pro aminopeptidase [Phycisphaerae bacterium SM23_30]|nr:MAG: Xaa-Pro aminopeptidase [Phycisphaerae bacterium SM23_30]